MLPLNRFAYLMFDIERRWYQQRLVSYENAILCTSQDNKLMFSLINAGWFVWPVCSFKFTALSLALFFMFLPRCMECRRGLAMRKLSVRPSVSLSVKRVDCDKTKESCARILTPHERPFTLVLWQEEWLVRATSSSIWNFGSNWPRWSEIADF